MYFKIVLLLLLWFGWLNLSIVLLLLNMIVNKFHNKIFSILCSNMLEDYNKCSKPFKIELFKELNDMKPGEKISVLEVGAGPGANFKYYNRDMTIQSVEPNHHFASAFVANREKYSNLEVKDLKIGYGEDLAAAGIESNSVDAVVVTLVLCSVLDQAKCFSEIKRVLKPGGKFFYMEHIADDANSHLRLVQQILTSIGFWQWAFAGFCLDK